MSICSGRSGRPWRSTGIANVQAGTSLILAGLRAFAFVPDFFDLAAGFGTATGTTGIFSL